MIKNLKNRKLPFSEPPYLDIEESIEIILIEVIKLIRSGKLIYSEDEIRRMAKEEPIRFLEIFDR